MFPMNSTKAFAWPVWKGYTFEDTTYTQDALRDSMTAVECRVEMDRIAGRLEELFNEDSRSVWFYFGYDEAPANQWNRMVSDSSAYDNYMPNLFTQAYDTLYRPDLGDTVIQPRFTEVDSQGVLSWMRWHIGQVDSIRQQSFVISTMHTINDWAGYSNADTSSQFYPPSNFETQADVVRSIFGMEYQAYNDSGPVQPFPEPNHPGFIAYDPYPDETYAKATGLSYVELNELYAKSDIISLHCPLTPETSRLINRDTIDKMKRGVMIINTGRGKLIDTLALIDGLKSGLIGSAGLDVYEEESDYFFEDRSAEMITDDVLARLLTFPNVIVTSHQAFFTGEALHNIAETTLNNFKEYFSGGHLANEICYQCNKTCIKKDKKRCF